MSDSEKQQLNRDSVQVAPTCVDPYHLLLANLELPADELSYLEILALIRYSLLLDKIKGQKIPAQ